MTAYSVYWPEWLCDRLVEAGLAGTPMRVCFGGDYESLPNFNRLAIRRDDELVAITVRDGKLLLIARMRLWAVVDAASWLNERPEDALYVLDDRTTQTVTGTRGTPIRFDNPVPPEKVGLWRKTLIASSIGRDDHITDPAAFHGVRRIDRAVREAIAAELPDDPKPSLTDLDTLAARALDQRDEASVLVYADALQQNGDPRGEVIILEHQLEARPDREAMESIEARLVELNAAHRHKLFGKPGGFPFRGAWGTRSYLRASMGRANNLTPVRAPEPLHEAVFSLFRRLGHRPWLKRFDFYGLASIHGHRDAVSALKARISAVLAGYDHLSSQVWTCDDAANTVAIDALHALIAESEDGAVPGLLAPLGLRLSFRFRLRDPQTGHPLPFQAGLHYSSVEVLESALEVDLKSSSVFLDLAAPFEVIGDEFQAIRKIVEETLGRAPREDAVKIYPDRR